MILLVANSGSCTLLRHVQRNHGNRNNGIMPLELPLTPSISVNVRLVYTKEKFLDCDWLRADNLSLIINLHCSEN